MFSKIFFCLKLICLLLKPFLLKILDMVLIQIYFLVKDSIVVEVFVLLFIIFGTINKRIDCSENNNLRGNDTIFSKILFCLKLIFLLLKPFLLKILDMVLIQIHL